MGSFLEGPNRSADFVTLGAAIGINKDTLAALKGVYAFAADKLGKYLQLGGSLITGAGAAVAVAAELVKVFGLIDAGKTDFDKLYDRIHQDLQKIENKIEAASRHEDQKDLAEIETAADAIQARARRYTQQIANNNGANNPEANGFDQFDSQSELLVGRFYQDALWQRLADEQTVVTVTGADAKRFAPPPESDPELVWDYRPALPVFVKAIHARLAYLAARNPTFRDDNATELAAMADFVTKIHNRIQSGIRLIPAPPPIAGQYQKLMGFMPSTQWFAHVWEKWGSPCGAVDIYGAVALVEKFPATQPEWHVFFTDPAKFKLAGSIQFDGQVSDADFAAQLAEGQKLRVADAVYWRKFNLLFLARSLRARAELEVRIGLPELRDLVVQLRALSRGRFATIAPPAARGYSVRDLVAPSQDVLNQLTADKWWYTSMASGDGSIQAGFTVAPLFGGGSTRSMTSEFAADFGPLLGPVSVRSMVMGA